MLQLFLNVLAGFINLLQVGQETASIALENLQDEAGTLERPEIANALLGEVIDDGRIARADGDNHLVAQHDAQRDCTVHIARALGINIWNIHDNQRLLLIRVVVNAGGFLFVQRGGQEGRIKVEAGGQTIHFLLRWALQMHPHALFQRRAFGQMILDGLEDSSHVSAASFQHFRRKAARSASVSRQSAADGLRGTIRITVHAVRHSFPAFAGCLPECHAFYLTPISRNCQRGMPQEIRKWCFISIICLACALRKSYKRHADAFANAVPVLFSEEILENQTNLQKNFVFPMAFLQNISIIE